MMFVQENCDGQTSIPPMHKVISLLRLIWGRSEIRHNSEGYLSHRRVPEIKNCNGVYTVCSLTPMKTGPKDFLPKRVMIRSLLQN